MIAVEEIHGNAGLIETAHLTGKKQPRIVISPVPIIKVPGDNEEGNLFFDSKSDKLCKSVAGSQTNPLNSPVLMPGKAPYLPRPARKEGAKSRLRLRRAYELAVAAFFEYSRIGQKGGFLHLLSSRNVANLARIGTQF